MFGFLGKLFGSDKAGAALVDNVSSGLDKMFYTDEEKAEDGRAERSEGRKLYLDWVKSTQGSNLARRLIALVVTAIWALQYVISMSLYALAPWFPDQLELMRQSATSLSENGEAVTGAMMIVLGFYFLGSKVDKIVDGAMIKFGRTNK